MGLQVLEILVIVEGELNTALGLVLHQSIQIVTDHVVVVVVGRTAFQNA